MRDVDCGGTATDVHSAVGEVSEVQVHSVYFTSQHSQNLPILVCKPTQWCHSEL